MDKTIELKRDGNVITLVLDKVLYVQLPEMVPSMRATQTSSTIYLAGAQISVVYEEGKRVRDALRRTG